MSEVWTRMAITPEKVENLDKWTEGALKRGATALVLRFASPPPLSELWEWAKRWEGIPWIVHARWTKLPIGWGMHFPAPPLLPPPRPDPGYLYGQSCHTEEEVDLAIPWASYMWIGPIFSTPSHSGQTQLFSLDRLHRLCRKYPSFPLVAIGGIENEERIHQVKTAGAVGFAAIRYFL
ncbi:MAG: thiamine phosphate synthase [Bacteroidia bacterium]|nr:thiamine phosphate synthase [Bacteroidia bacterium]MDW8134556.1 thiamine phosphate synthase [Bacteroidia bacterium]